MQNVESTGYQWVTLAIWRDRGDGTTTHERCVATSALQAAERLSKSWTVVDGAYRASNGQVINFVNNSFAVAGAK